MSIKKYFTAYVFFYCLFGLHFQSAVAQKADPPGTILEYLSREEGAKMTLDADMTTLLANRHADEYYPAILTLADGKTFQVRIKPKGKYRRKVAEVPPLKIKFTKKSLLAEKLDTLNEVKLVLPVYDNSLGDELIIREYLVYRMFEQLTGASVRARLVRLTLRDTHVEKSRKEMYAILVEDDEETAKRLNGEEAEQYGMPADSMIVHQAALVAMFEYMIGNTDWDMSMMRNVRFVRSKENGKVLVLPYDFDFSGFVAAPYASPAFESGLVTVRDRYLMANGIGKDALRRATQRLKNAKADLYNICRSKYLSRESSIGLIEYLETFYEQIDRYDDVPVRMRVPLTE